MATVRIQVRRGTASQWSTTNPVLAAGEMGVETDTNKFKFGNGTATWSALSYANADTAGITEISQDAINAALSMGTGLTKTYNDGANTITIAIDDTVWANRSYVAAAVSALSNTVDTTYIPLDDRGAVNGVASLNAQGKVPTSETDLTVMATRAYAEYLQTQDLLAVDTHAAKTTNVHGIPDVSLLATLANVGTARTDLTTYTNTKFDAARDYTDTKFDEARDYTDAEVDTTTAYVNTQHGLAMTAATNAGTSANTYTDNKSVQDRAYADGQVSGHSSDTTNVHGIADTSLLATKSYADTASSTAQTAAIAAADTALGAHTSDTTNVHGIADTSLLATTANVATAKSEAITAAGTAADTKVSTAVSALTKSSVGLANVDNTSDANKPVSTATQTALDLKANLETPTFTGTVVLPSTTSIGNVSATELGYLDGVTSSVQTQLTARLPLAGGTMTGALTLSGAPTSDLHAATKLYVDNVTAGINFHESVHAASTSSLAANYSNGTSGTGATLTADTSRAFSVLDGETVVLGERVLVKNQADAKQNGIYTLTTVGSGSTPWVLTRATDADNNPTGEMKTGDFTFVQRGTVNASVGYINNSTANPIVIGTDNISYTEFNAGKTIVAGSGLAEAIPGTLSIATGGVTSAMIADGAIVDADVNASAAIAQSKISGLTSDLAAKAPLASPTFTGIVTVAASGVAFTDGTQTKEGVPSRTPIVQKTASYTLSSLTERDNLIEVASGSATTITIPTDSAVNYPIGTSIDILQTSTGQVTIAGAGGVTVNATPGLKLRTQWSSASLLKRAANTWIVMGDLSA